MAFFYNIANGFHNAPSFILNDTTVRRRDNITGFGSGVKVAGKVWASSSFSLSFPLPPSSLYLLIHPLPPPQEFALSLYEAISGLVTQPYHGLRTQGATGLLKGTGKGFGGLILKSGAAAFAIPGYTLKGLERQLEKRRDRLLKATLLSTRMRQGISEYQNITKGEEESILSRWRELSGGAVGEVIV